jgi:hypothetical protein
MSAALPLRILIMGSKTADTGTDDVLNEILDIYHALRELSESGSVYIEHVAGETLESLQSALARGPWHIFHFIGHGDSEHLQITGSDEGPHWLTTQHLSILLSEHNWRLVFLNSCDSGVAVAANGFASTAAALLNNGIPWVIAMQSAVPSDSARTFARTFYLEFRQCKRVGTAVARARSKVAISGSSEWALPILYSQTEDEPMLPNTAFEDEPVPLKAASEIESMPSRPAPKEITSRWWAWIASVAAIVALALAVALTVEVHSQPANHGEESG